MLLQRTEAERLEDRDLAPWAMRSAGSRGRRYPEEEHPLRTAFQRDRDRIIHSTAFRRLEYKTQVFVNHEGDYYRTRLTHTMEAAQIARTIARILRLNADLAEAVALAHDLGHTPFGHAGERVLDRLMQPWGGFEHNRQSLRIVDVLEERYPSFPGLNLSWEVREGIVKHSPPYDRPAAAAFDSGSAPALEVQVVDLADEIAYNSHDIDDGMKSGLLSAEDLASVRLWGEAYGEVRKAAPASTPRIWRYQAVRWIIDRLVRDLVETTAGRVRDLGVRNVQDVRTHGAPIVGFSEEVDRQRRELKAFLMEKLYRHHRVVRMMAKAQRVIEQLFAVYVEQPQTLPPHILARCERGGEEFHRVVADYIAGMTDRFALQEHRKLLDPLERT